MNILVTGGTGFIGSHVVDKLVSEGHQVLILDNLSNSSRDNIKCHFLDCNMKFVEGDIRDKKLLSDMFEAFKFNICYHLASNTNVQNSIDNPNCIFDNDLSGTLNVLEECRKYNTKIVFTSAETVCDKPMSPYAAIKISAENLIISYYHTYNLKASVLRFPNVYGPRQKTIEENINDMVNELRQDEELLFVKDCAEIIVKTGMNDKFNGQVIEANIINLDDFDLEAKTTFEQGIQITCDWIKNGKQDIAACRVCSSDKSSCYME